MPVSRIRAVCFDWGGTLMPEDGGPNDIPMGLWPELRVIPGAHDVLAALHGRYALHIATNATVSRRPMIERALARVDLLRYFNEIFCYTEIGHRKDEAAFWDEVARRLGLPLRQIAMVGDSLEQDVQAPRRFGVCSVWFNDGGRAAAAPEVAVPTITRLGELVGFLDGARQGLPGLADT
jgi:FMN phosphatase YigB (HAD superfamily)